MLKTIKMAKDVETNDWFEIGGNLFQVVTTEVNDFGNIVFNLRHDPGADSSVLLILFPVMPVEALTQL